LVDRWIGVFNCVGYETSLEWVEAVEKGEYVPIYFDEDDDDEYCTKANQDLRFQDPDKWEIIRLIEYLKSRQELGRNSYRVPIVLS